MSCTTRADRELGALTPRGVSGAEPGHGDRAARRRPARAVVGPRPFLKERGRSRPRLVVFSLVCELPDPGWRVEIGVGGQGSGGARARRRPQGLDGDAVRRTMFRTGKSKRLVAAFGFAEQWGRWRLQGRFPGVGQAR